MKTTTQKQSSLTTTHRYISLADAAELMGVSVRTVRRWIAQGRLTAYRGGQRVIRVRQADLDDFWTQIPSV